MPDIYTSISLATFGTRISALFACNDIIYQSFQKALQILMGDIVYKALENNILHPICWVEDVKTMC